MIQPNSSKSRERKPTQSLNALAVVIGLFLGASVKADESALGVASKFADSNGVKIHYVTKGEGDPIVLIHGFPDYWYSWRDQIPALAQRHKVIAIDQRGYNLSGQPEGVENYTIELLVSDVVAVLDHQSIDQATILGHDWGGMVAWSFAMTHPERAARLIILNLPHPDGLRRELATNPQQRANSQYARDFQRPNASAALSAESLAEWVRDPEAQKAYVQAFRRSNFEAMLNYYKANYPREPYEAPSKPAPRVQCDTLQIHGLQDPYLLETGLNGTWNWIDGVYTLVTIPNANHFVHRDAPAIVNQTLLQWLNGPSPTPVSEAQ